MREKRGKRGCLSYADEGREKGGKKAFADREKEKNGDMILMGHGR